jgi:hypothetical protein
MKMKLLTTATLLATLGASVAVVQDARIDRGVSRRTSRRFAIT